MSTNLLPDPGISTAASNWIGQPANRVDGPAKVTGTAKYAGEFAAEGLCFGVVVSSAIARGRITSMDTEEALAVPGVVQVYTHKNRPHMARRRKKYKDDDAPKGPHFRPLYEEEIQFSMQPVALVVAETFEAARYAASLVKVEYESKPCETDLHKARVNAYPAPKGKSGYEPPPPPRGDSSAALATAPRRIDAEYGSPFEHHNPMEMHASTVIWNEDGTLTVFDKTQGVLNSQKLITQVFGLPKKKVRVMSPFVGGAFGSGLRPGYQLILAAMAALDLKRSVRVTLTRQQMFTFGHRPHTINHLRLGASEDGRLLGLEHHAIGETSQYEEYTEVVVNWSGQLYSCPNVTLDYKITHLDIPTPMDMRAPGACIGINALECAMDEMAYEIRMDPLEFRLRNYAERDENKDKPFTSKELREAYRQGAERFGWAGRPVEPRSMRDGHKFIGWGIATGSWEAVQKPARARATLRTDGKVEVASATADIGTGTYTAMTQIAAEVLGLPLSDVSFKLGDTSLPMAPLEGGSWTVSSVGSAVYKACRNIGKKLLKLAQALEDSPFNDAIAQDVEFVSGSMRLKTNPSVSISIREILNQNGNPTLQTTVTGIPNMLKQSRYTGASHSAVFVEVAVDEDLGTVEVRRVVNAVAGGRVLNPKTARSQVIGGVVMGLGMALEEETFIDPTLGRFMNHNLAEYHVPVNKDVPDIDVIFVPERDDIINPLGMKGLGEIGIVGVAAAVSNAVFHATGKRIRDFPITPDRLVMA